MFRHLVDGLIFDEIRLARCDSPGRLSGFTKALGFDETSIGTARVADELLMSAVLEDLAATDDEDLVSVLDR